VVPNNGPGPVNNPRNKKTPAALVPRAAASVHRVRVHCFDEAERQLETNRPRLCPSAHECVPLQIGRRGA